MPEFDEQENPREQMCQFNGKILSRDHPIFGYQDEIRMAQAELGLAISEGVRLQATRELLDMLDTLSQIMIDPESKLPDQQRKMLNHADEVWLDLKEKMSQGDRRAAHLLNSSAHMNRALSYLVKSAEDPEFSSLIPEYLLKYLGKLSTFVYREAIGHVML
ncbi:MAG: DUF1940 domain-containing protein [Candidatus Thermoplasmatota archaeon]|nr:DUF1940 domain-containing protein [Candidatus Thermoplasmatota archaeon]